MHLCVYICHICRQGMNDERKMEPARIMRWSNHFDKWEKEFGEQPKKGRRVDRSRFRFWEFTRSMGQAGQAIWRITRGNKGAGSERKGSERWRVLLCKTSEFGGLPHSLFFKWLLQFWRRGRPTSETSLSKSEDRSEENWFTSPSLFLPWCLGGL